LKEMEEESRRHSRSTTKTPPKQANTHTRGHHI
jgi:hypothetical protein